MSSSRWGGFLTHHNLFVLTTFFFIASFFSFGVSLASASEIQDTQPRQFPHNIIELLPQNNKVLAGDSEHVADIYNFTILDEYFQHQFVNQRLKGSFALKIGDQTWIKQFDQSQKLIDNNTMYRVGSVTKTYVAVLAAIAIDKKLMRWDTTINTWLDTTRYAKKLRYADNITVYHLLTMTAGLACDFTWADAQVGKAYNMTFDSFINVLNLRSRCQQDPDLIDQPAWSENSYWLLARWLPFVFGIIRSEDDLDGGFTELLEQEITKPLNLTQTTTLLAIHDTLDPEKDFYDDDSDASVNNHMENSNNQQDIDNDEVIINNQYNADDKLNVVPSTYHLDKNYHWKAYKKQVDITKAGGSWGVIASPSDVVTFFEKVFIQGELISDTSRGVMTEWKEQRSGALYGMGLRLITMNNTYKHSFGEVSSFDFSLSGALMLPIDPAVDLIKQPDAEHVTFSYSLNGVALPADFIIDAIVNFTQHQPLYLLNYKENDVSSEAEYKNLAGHYSWDYVHISYTVKRIEYSKNQCALPWKKHGLIISEDGNNNSPATPLVWQGPNPDGDGYGRTNEVQDSDTYWHFSGYALSSMYFEGKVMKLITAGTVAMVLEYYTLPRALHLGRWLLLIVVIIIIAIIVKKCCINKKKKATSTTQDEFTINTESANQQYEQL